MPGHFSSGTVHSSLNQHNSLLGIDAVGRIAA
jgi:hypothetical protein